MNRNDVHPEPYDDYEKNEIEIRDFALVTVFGEKKLRPLFVITEMWKRKGYGRGKRAYLAEFTKAERKMIGAWQSKIYRWYLVTGIPRTGVRMSVGTYALLSRAANFFAGL